MNKSGEKDKQQSYDEICNSLNISYKTARNHISQALTKLREEMGNLPLTNKSRSYTKKP